MVWCSRRPWIRTKNPPKAITWLEYHRRVMGSFPGGSAWAMARDIGDGYVLVTPRTFANMSAADLDKVNFEMDRRLRDIRGTQPDQDDIQALQLRNRRLQRISQARAVLTAYRRRRKV